MESQKDEKNKQNKTVDQAKKILADFKENIEEWKNDFSTENIGEVIEVSEGIALAGGLSEIMYGEKVIIEPKYFDDKSSHYEPITGMVLNLEEDKVGIIVFGDYTNIKEGDIVRSTGEKLNIGVGKNFLGRVIDVLGNPIDGNGEIKADKFYPLENKAPGIIEREKVNTPLQTGIKAIDAAIPIGRGQRELILGDRQTGKTAIVIDTIINQKNNTDRPVYCIYVAIGQKDAKVARIVNALKERGAMDYTIVVNAGASEGAAYLYVAPYVGCAIGEYFRDQGFDALVIYDDLSKHAVAWREISLLLRRPPGREAYPGDVFFLHSRLLERSARLSKDKGGGSLTALPIIETLAGDISSYIPTNVISITDGQIFLESDLFHQGFKPAINVGLSVSRVGSDAQTEIIKKISGKLKLELSQFRELAAFTQFGSEIDPETKKKLDKGQKLSALLNQPQYSPLSVAEEACLIYASVFGYWDGIKLEDIPQWQEKFIEYLSASQSDLLDKINKNPKFSDENKSGIEKAIEDFNQINK